MKHKYTPGSLFGVSALFTNTETFLLAVKEVQKKGFTHWDANSSYPILGLDKAMKLKPSRISWVTLISALFAGVFALAFMSWIMMSVYPLNIGGKPFFSIPAFVPVWFAFSILISVPITVFSLFVFWLKLPFASHPLQDSVYLKEINQGKFGICIEKSDPLFETKVVQELLQNLGAEVITKIFVPYESKETNFFVIPIFNIAVVWKEWMFVAILLCVITVVSGLTYGSYNLMLYDRIPNVGKLYTWMDTQEKAAPQKADSFFKDGSSMRSPVSGTIARNWMQSEPSVNPIAITKENLIRGRVLYNAYCSMCHGYFGNSKGRLNGEFAVPPGLNSQKMKTASDSLIYGIITKGQNQMASYASQIGRKDRWKIVQYIRVLQRAQDAPLRDLEGTK